MISVQDNGGGIPEEMQHKVFEPNFTTKSSGMGLGLALVKNLVNSFGGAIGFDTSEKGTTFIIVLPLLNPKQK
jgi:two-component system nitrogen regulation sensor histidine kinase NtrY